MTLAVNSITTAMILAAGKGERMRPLTEHHPKPLLKVGGKALIEWQIHKLVAAGISRIVINQGWLGEQLPEALGQGEAYGVELFYSDEQSFPEPLETAGGIIHALPLLGDAPFVVVNGDVWTDYDYAQLQQPNLVASLTKQMDAHLVLINNPPHNPAGDFVLNNGLLQTGGLASLTFSGIGVYHPRLFAQCQPGRQALAPILRTAMQKNRIAGSHYAGEWFDIGTPERLAALNQRINVNL